MECEKCLCHWDLEVHIPKILQCGHTVCQACLLSMLNESNSSGNQSFRCPVCQDENQSLRSKSDISNLKENQILMSIADKVESNKKKIKLNPSISLSVNLNSYELDKSNLLKSQQLLEGIKNCYFPVCEIHKSKANFYHMVNNEIVYICNECIKTEIYEKLEPLPNLVMQNEIKINACKKRTKLLYSEIDRIEEFLKNYQIQFEQANKKKIDELFDYIQKIVKYNQTTANTLYNQCKNEQQRQINQKIDELNILRKELSDFENQLDEIQNNKLYLIKPDPENQNKLDNVFNKLGNYINYESELNLFQIDVNIHEDIKDSIFDLIQTAYEINVDYLKMENGELPSIKMLLNKSTSWPCSCGEKDNKIGKIICQKCSRYRPLETYNNILFNPLIIRKDELTEFHMRRKHEEKVFRSLLERYSLNKDETLCKLFAIDMKWFNKWKTYVTNDMEENIMPNNDKYISDNKLIGILPPGEIDNSKICIRDKNNNKYRLKPGLVIKKDYCAINQFLWEWLKLNYNGGPEIDLLGVNQGKQSLKSNTDNNCNLLKKFSDKSDSIIENNGSVFVVDSEENFPKENKSNENQLTNMDSVNIRDSINKVNTVDAYKFNTKFCEFRIHNDKTNESFLNQKNKQNKELDFYFNDTFQ